MSSKVLESSAGFSVRPWFERPVRQAQVPTAFLGPQLNQPETERRVDARREIDEIRQQVEAVKAQAFQDGLAAGQEAARAEAQEELRVALDRLAVSAAQLANLKHKLRKEAEHEILKLTFAVARRIVRRELSMDADTVLGLLNAGLSKISRKDLQTIHVHPDHAAQIRAALEDEGITTAEVVADTALTLGDILFETKQGSLDARLETQFAEIENGFADRI
ncbi:FliH/SctL family protein [uncultured Paludibaculum sp.]|uniref:FliH/SctL family protein n=1 Tax=uncultured Paludibaculum sp. TaxID=1765020 RepID=UPI002AAC09E7|nr:FliH/SctL family protein [uncultured Paludibaculum sp.]